MTRPRRHRHTWLGIRSDAACRPSWRHRGYWFGNFMRWKALLAKLFGNIASVRKSQRQQLGGASFVLPYQVSEAPRLLLHVLTKSSALDDAIKSFIANWLIGYDHYLHSFLANSYGPDAVLVADAITSQVYANMIDAFAEQYDLSTATSFATWDQELAAEGDASSS
jgi:hypothetical protein